MARYWNLVIYTTGAEYETRERLIDEETFRQYQKAIMGGATHLVLEDRIIKVSQIKEVLPANDVVREYQDMGIPLKQLGLKEPTALPKTENAGQLKEKFGENYGKIGV